jgi:hypothetical protein
MLVVSVVWFSRRFRISSIESGVVFLEPPTTRRCDARYRRFSKDALLSRVAIFFVVSPFLSGSRLSYQ